MNQQVIWCEPKVGNFQMMQFTSAARWWNLFSRVMFSCFFGLKLDGSWIEKKFEQFAVELSDSSLNLLQRLWDIYAENEKQICVIPNLFWASISTFPCSHQIHPSRFVLIHNKIWNSSNNNIFYEKLFTSKVTFNGFRLWIRIDKFTIFPFATFCSVLRESIKN